jgi:hypothetical protein
MNHYPVLPIETGEHLKHSYSLADNMADNIGVGHYVDYYISKEDIPKYNDMTDKEKYGEWKFTKLANKDDTKGRDVMLPTQKLRLLTRTHHKKMSGGRRRATKKTRKNRRRYSRRN